MIHPARIFVRKQTNGEQTMILMVVAGGELKSLTDEALHDCTVLEIDDILTISVDDSAKTHDFYGLRADQVLCSHSFSQILDKIREEYKYIEENK